MVEDGSEVATEMEDSGLNFSLQQPPLQMNPLQRSMIHMAYRPTSLFN